MAIIKRNLTSDMTVGSPLKIILLFALPILIGNIFQQLYNVADAAIIGNLLGDDAFAAVGATASVYGLFIFFSIGLTSGFSVIIARYYGAKDNKNVGIAVNMTYALTLGSALILTVVSLLCTRPLLEFLETPPQIIDNSAQYLSIVLSFTVFTMLYNAFAGMLRAIGNSIAPLCFLAVSTVLNIVLDILFIQTLNLGIAGAAYATGISQIVSALLCFIYVVKKSPLLVPRKKHMVFSRQIFSQLFTTGISMGLMQGIVSIGSVALQGAVNSFGPATIAAHTAARKVDDIFMLPLGTLTMAASTFASQNFGAKKIERVKKGITLSLFIGFAWSVFSIICVYFGGNAMAHLITGSTDTEIIDTAVMYVRINIPFFFILSVLLVLRSSLQGIGKRLVPLIASGIELAAKFIAVWFVTPVLGYFGVCILEPIIWSICAALVFVEFVIVFRKFKRLGNQDNSASETLEPQELEVVTAK